MLDSKEAALEPLVTMSLKPAMAVSTYLLIITINGLNAPIKIHGDKEEHYIMIKGSVQQEDITIINIYAPNIGAPKFVQKILTIKRGNRMQCIHLRRLQHTTHSKGQINQTENK